MSGNGQKISHQATAVGPAQNGGGCVQSGPFAKLVHHVLDIDLIANLSSV